MIFSSQNHFYHCVGQKNKVVGFLTKKKNYFKLKNPTNTFRTSINQLINLANLKISPNNKIKPNKISYPQLRSVF
jgi:hypothetical protein